MERPDNVGDREDQSNNNGNEEIQIGSTGNQRNPLDPSWTTKAKYGRDAAILWPPSFKTKKEGITTNFIQCYAPTNDINDDNKDRFYERLQSIIEKCPRKDLTIPMGDPNAIVGIDNIGYEDIMGQHGLTGTEKRKRRKICKSMCIQQIGHRSHNIST
ncbi:unnamed protein product [Schistosoma curassoni]|uniref:Craniofacial development protein 2-like n=1 Tax=Schistosoma curassoni TaxID=6186 RepID=A0A183L164_9TREM|nr:unnamed protein product [Schistosoma curassoni]